MESLMFKLFILFSIVTTSLSAGKITWTMIPDTITYAYLQNECLHRSGECYPFVIGVNRTSDIAKVKKLGYNISKGRLIDCKTEEGCSAALSKLISNGITNVDNGPFQINYFWNPDKNLENFFSYTDSKKKVRMIVASLINKHGYTWETLGRYHSGTPHLNKAYYKKLYRHINGVPFPE